MVNEDWGLLRSFLPEDWAAQAAASGALKGLRQDKSPENLLRTLMLHVACGFSLRETVVRARQADLASLSDVALMKRLRKSRDWLYGLCVALFRERGLEVGSAGGRQFRLFDATHVKEPGKTGSLWRIHYSICVPSLVCDFFKVTETKGEGTGESLRRYPIQAGDHIIVDRGYSTAPGLQYAASCGAFVCVRLNPGSVPMLDETGGKVELSDRLRALVEPGEVGCWPAWIADTEAPPLSVRVCAVRKSEAAIQLAHKKLKQRASKRGTELGAETLFLAQYVIIATTFPQTEFTPADVLECYRVRWQIELVFKRFKQIAQLGHLPKHDDQSAKAWLYGKLFAALLTEKIVCHAHSVSPWGYDLARCAVAQRVA
jgi:hypothetical protein